MADTTFVNGTVITAEWLNAVNDFVYNPKNTITFTGPGDGTDQTALMLSTIAAAKAAGGPQEIYLPNGVYVFSSNLELGMPAYNNTEGAISIRGESTTNCIIRPNLTGDTALFSFTGGNLNYRTFGKISNLTIDPNVPKSGLGCAVKIESTIGNKVENVIIRNMKYGVWLYNGVQFGGAGWCEYNQFNHVTIDFCDDCWRLEHSASNTNPIPSHGYNNFIHCLGNVYAEGSLGPGNPQIFVHLVNDKVNFYNSKFEFYANTQDGGILIQANGNGGAPDVAGGRAGLMPSNTGSFQVESNSACYVTGNRTFWWTGLLSFVPANFYDLAGISIDFPGYSVIRCDNYEYSGSDLNTPASIDRFTDTVLNPAYPLARTGQMAPWIAIEDSGKRGLLVYTDSTDGTFALGTRGATAKLQDIAVKAWIKLNGKLRGNAFGFRERSDTVALTTTATAFASFPAVDGCYTVYVKGTTPGLPAYVFSVAKAQDVAAAVINTASGAPSNPGAHTITCTWPASSGIRLAVSNAAIAGNYSVTVVGVNP